MLLINTNSINKVSKLKNKTRWVNSYTDMLTFNTPVFNKLIKLNFSTNSKRRFRIEHYLEATFHNDIISANLKRLNFAPTSIIKSNKLPKLNSTLVKPMSVTPAMLISQPFFHHFHLVKPSPWPFLVAISLWVTILSLIALFHHYGNTIDLLFGFGCLVAAIIAWLHDIVVESTYELKHTPQVRRGLLLGMALFILSEAFLFFGFFWAFFHSSLVPAGSIGGVWPPLNINIINPWHVPLLNTLILIMSGFTYTIAHRTLKEIGYHDTAYRITYVVTVIFWLSITVILALIFLLLQAFEYYYASYSYYDTIYGTTFYSLTGLHGSHVLVGLIFILSATVRMAFLHFTSWKQVGFKTAGWYWHFVDVVWLFLFATVYVWGSSGI